MANTFEDGSGLNVNNHYGQRDTGQTAGEVKTEGEKTQVKFNINGADITAGGPALDPIIIPAGSIILEVYTETVSIFTTGNADNVVDIGTDTTEATNGFTIAAADLLNAGKDEQTTNLSGTWDAQAALVADTTIGFAVSGTTAAISSGEMNVTIIYI